MKHSQIVFSQLFIARGETPIQLKTIDQPFDAVAHPIDDLIKRSPVLRVFSSRNRVVDTPAAQIAAVVFGTIALITYHPVGTLLRSSRSWSVNGPSFHPGFEKHRVMPLSWTQDEDHRLVFTFTTDVDLGRKAAPGVS
jgi:hypothetical protein